MSRDLAKGFGGIRAVNGVSLDLQARGVHAVIGPNGAGKTTLINLLSGDLAPSAGSIRLLGREIAGLPPERIARLGVGRSYQRDQHFFPTLRRSQIVGWPHRGACAGACRFCGATADAAVAGAAKAALVQVGLQFPERTGAALSHGEQRQLEIAMTLAMSPKVLLLDEPLAGMGPEEAERMTTLISRLGEDHAVLLVEHDMDAVFRIAETLTVMVDGKVLETGTPAKIRASAAVQEAYLGHERPE